MTYSTPIYIGKIYGLTDPRKGHSIRYIGQTTQTITRRLSTHLHVSKIPTTPVARWIRKLYGLGLTPGVCILHDNVPPSDLNALEIQAIAKYRTKQKLLNVSDGGQGRSIGYKHTEETRAKISAALSGVNNPNFGKTHSLEAITKMSVARTGTIHSKDTRKKMSEAQRGSKSYLFGKKLSVETRTKLSAAKSGVNNPRFGKPVSLETRDKISKAAKRRNLTKGRL